MPAHPSESNLFPLKLLVISLGMVLLGAIIFLSVVLVGKVSEQAVGKKCEDAVVSLHSKGTITNVLPQRDIVQITLLTPPKTQLITAERCTGKIIQTLTIEP